MDDLSRLTAYIMDQSEKALEIQRFLTAAPALGPENGGQGEAKKASLLEEWLDRQAIPQLMRCDATDARVESGARPNLIRLIEGKSSAKTLWLFAHLDVVPPGDPNAWQTDPWQVHKDGDVIYGRGVEDNQQAIASMLILADALLACGIVPSINLGLVFMADEESGSSYGLQHILRETENLFGQNDLLIVPDGGYPDASRIEIAEKGQLWLKFTVKGKQCHASLPNSGVNSLVAASHLVILLNTLNEMFPAKNQLFEPPASTFMPTKHDANVEAINILPGQDVFYMDCRLLPEVKIPDVLQACRKMCAAVAHRQGVKIELDIVHEREATATAPDAPVVKALEKAIKEVYGVTAKPCGIGGATVAAFLRDLGLPVAVWSCLQNTCHQPNERSSLSAALADAAVFAHVLMNS